MSLIETPFKLTHAEKLLSAASTLCLMRLSEAEVCERTINDICLPSQYGYTASASLEPCGPRFVRTTDVQSGTVDWTKVPYCECPNPDTYMLASGDILVARSGSVGKSFLVVTVPEPAVFASYMIRLRCKSVVLPAYVYWCFQSQQFWRQMVNARRGSAMSNINGKMLSELRFPIPSLQVQEAVVSFLTTFRERLRGSHIALSELPPPLDEQRRIVAHIEALAARIEQARGLRREALAEAEALWRSALLSAFMQQDESFTGMVAADLLDHQKEKYAKAERSNYNGAHPWEPNVYHEGFYDIPSSWVWTDLGSMLTLFVDCVNDTPDFSLVITEFLGLKSTNIRPYRLDLHERWFVTEDDYSRWNRRATPLPGDLILTREAPMGNVCELPDGVTACLTQRLMLLRSDVEFVSTRYLLHYLNSPHFQSQVLEQCRGLTTPHIRVKDAPFLKVPLPPRRIQDEIVTFLDDVQTRIDDLRRQQAISAAELDALLPSILDQAFRGEL